MKIRCPCNKRIQVDDAFAGGMCRCPYCKAIVYVPEMMAAGTRAASRPAFRGGRPGIPSVPRPAMPGERPSAPAAIPSSRPAAPIASSGQAASSPNRPSRQMTADGDHIPMARPVMFQGIVMLVMLGVLIVMIGGTVVMAVKILSRYTTVPPQSSPAPQKVVSPKPATPVKQLKIVSRGPVVAGDVSFVPPVVYCIDIGSTMSETYDFAVMLARASVKSLQESQRFNLFLCGDRQETLLTQGLIPGGQQGVAKISEFMTRVSGQRLGFGAGSSNLTRAYNRAIGLHPKTIVFFCHKPLDVTLAAKAKSAGIKIVLVTIDGAELEHEFKRFATQAGGEYRLLSNNQLQGMLPVD